MSADNWAVCPWCQLRLNDSLRKAKSDMDAKYGKIPASEFIAESAEIEKRASLMPETTLREDYEIQVSVAGFFTVDYVARCEAQGCGFRFDFTKKETIPAPPKK